MLFILVFGALLCSCANAGSPEFLACVRNCDADASVPIFKGCIRTCALLHLPTEAGRNTNALVEVKYKELKRKRDEEKMGLLNKQL